MLVVIILKRLGKADRREPRFDEGQVVATPTKAVRTENQADIVTAVNVLDRASQLPRGRVLAVRPAVRKDAHAMRAAGSEIGADDVIVEHCADLVAVLLQILEQAGAAEQALFFAGDRREDQRRPVLEDRPDDVGDRKQPRAFQAHRRAGSIVIGAGRVGVRVHDVRGHGVEVA